MLIFLQVFNPFFIHFKAQDVPIEKLVKADSEEEFLTHACIAVESIYLYKTLVLRACFS